MDAIGRVASAAGIAVVEDAAQAHGATWNGRRAGGLRGPAVPDAIHEVLIFQGERFVEPDVRRDDVAVAVREGPLVWRRSAVGAPHAPVVDAQALLGQVIVDGHLLVTDHRDRPHLPRIEPGKVDEGGDADLLVLEAYVREILDRRAGE